MTFNLRASAGRRPRCDFCGRVITYRALREGLAKWHENPGGRDTHEHTYDCEGVPLRRRKPTPMWPRGTPK